MLDGQVLDDPGRGVLVPPEQRSCGLVFQEHLLFPHLDALANVAFGPRRRGASKSEATTVARDWLDRLGVADVAHHRPRHMSGGESQRVALARALAVGPRLLLLDEPSMGLAPMIVETIFSIISQIRDAGTTVFVVEQNATQALRLADRGYVMENGRIVFGGPAADLLHDERVRAVYLGESVET